MQATYLFRLEHPLSSTQDGADILGLSYVPRLNSGTREDGEVHFCCLSQFDIDVLDFWLGEHYPTRNFTKVRLNIAHKDLLNLPNLGRDSTLPHHLPSKPASPNKQDTNREDVYPMIYFFYRSLASPSRLSRLSNIPSFQHPRLERATLLNGDMLTWAGKYRALVDCPGKKVDGYIYPVISTDHEVALRVYAGDSYQIVCASVMLEGKETEVRTFRFCGFEDKSAR